MYRFFQPLLLLLAKSTDSEMARMVEYLKVENRVLRDRLPKNIQVTPAEKNLLLKAGKKLGAAISGLITIVSPRTFARWVNGDKPKDPTQKARTPGRPRTADDIRELVLRLARENEWGYTRILGELKKLGVHTVSRSTVVNILKEAGLDPNSRRGKGSWDEFLRQHAQTLWACDFFTKKVVTAKGFVDVFVLFFIHVGTRKVHVAGMTAHPDAAWVTQQARNTAMLFQEQPAKPRVLILDHDTKFVKGFDDVFAREGVELKRVGPLAPNMNAYAERFVQSVEEECLDRFIVFGEGHLRHLVSEYVRHYNAERPHQGVGNVPLADVGADTLRFPSGAVQCKERLGGLLKHYFRAA